MGRLETQCFKSVWVTVALHQGLTFPRSYGHLTAAPNTVHGEVVHWTLGALLYRTRYLPLRVTVGQCDRHAVEAPDHEPDHEVPDNVIPFLGQFFGQEYWEVWFSAPLSQWNTGWLCILNLHCLALPFCCIIVYCCVCLHATSLRE